MFPRLLLTSSSLAAPQLATAASQLIHGLARGAIVTTAEIKLKERSREAILAQATLTALSGAAVEFFDLDARSASELAHFDFLYVMGGNPFYLLKRMRETEADSVLEEFVAAGRPVIASGEGAVVIGLSLRPLRMFDSLAPDLGWKDLDALGLAPFAVVPHANRWSARFADYTGRLALARKITGCDIVELNDGETLLVENEHFTSIDEHGASHPIERLSPPPTAWTTEPAHATPIAQSA